jgi:phosphoglycolate phosphatase
MGVYEEVEAMKIFFDLDGTLVDASDRLYQLFQFLVPDSKLTKNSYWELKRNKISHQQILKTQFSYAGERIKTFEQAWLEMIELPEWIALDRPFIKVTEYLSEIKKHHSLFVITARQSEETATNQLRTYGWATFFDDVLVTKHRQEKSEMMKNKNVEISKDWLVGDTGKDIEAGKKIGLLSAAVLTGFLNREKLLEYNPDIIVNSVVDLTFKKK